MVEFYQAYATYEDMMNLSEDMLKYLAETVLGKMVLNYQGEDIDFGKPFNRLRV